MNNGKRTLLLGTVTLTSAYQTLQADDFDLPSIGADENNQVILHFVGDDLSDIVFTPQEQYIHGNPDVIGYKSLTRDDGSSNIVPLELTLNGGESYAWNTLADRVRVKVKSATNTGEISVYMTYGRSS